MTCHDPVKILLISRLFWLGYRCLNLMHIFINCSENRFQLIPSQYSRQCLNGVSHDKSLVAGAGNVVSGVGFVFLQQALRMNIKLGVITLTLSLLYIDNFMSITEHILTCGSEWDGSNTPKSSWHFCPEYKTRQEDSRKLPYLNLSRHHQVRYHLSSSPVWGWVVVRRQCLFMN